MELYYKRTSYIRGLTVMRTKLRQRSSVAALRRLPKPIPHGESKESTS